MAGLGKPTWRSHSTNHPRLHAYTVYKGKYILVNALA